jgi:hypothetical protein
MPLGRATVRITDGTRGITRDAATNRAGRFVAPLLSPGMYDVTVTAGDLAPATVHDVRVRTGDRLAIDVMVGAAPVERRWTSGDAAAQPLPAVQYVIDERAITTLPLINRHVASLVATVPGVASTMADEPSLAASPGDDLHLGGRRAATAWHLDGVPPLLDIKDVLGFTPSLESIDDVRVVAASASVTWPRGAAISLTSRAGSNTFRAGAYDFHRDSAIDANSFFRNHSLDPEERAGPPERTADIFGYRAAGPIRKDTAFFSWSQEWRRRRGESRADFVDARQETARVDVQAGRRWRLMARYTHDALDLKDRDPRGGESVGAAEATTVLAPSVVNDLSYRRASSVLGTTDGIADTLAVVRGDHAVALGGSFAQDDYSTHYEWFAQDSWRAHDRLTIDAGLRRGAYGWEPGIGAAWRPVGETVIRGGYASWETFTPERHWFAGVGRRLYANGSIDAAYVGRRSDDHVHERALRYDGLLAHFRHDGPHALLDVAYTLGRDQRREADWVGDVRTDRRHVFTATYSRDFGAWTIAGITTFQSGLPAPAVVMALPRRDYARQVGDPFVNLPSDQYYFNPAAFAPPIPGVPGSSESPFALPGKNQWDVSLSRAFRIDGRARVRLRADVFNLFNHTQFTTVDTVCTAQADEPTCAVANATLGQYTAVRAPRQIQLGIRLDWN